VNLDDTIVAVATPSGRGGIGVVRLAGPEARAIAAPMLRLPGGLEPGRAIVGELIEPGELTDPELAESHDKRLPVGTAGDDVLRAGEKIDEVVVTFFQKPHSYTTDDIVEISAHGSPVVLRHIVELALGRGARLAEPGEFTMRAFLNGRIDLTQAEAVRDLIESHTLYQAKVAAQQLDGALANRLRPIKQELVNLIAVLEAGVDFAEDDVSVMPATQILDRIAGVRAPLQTLAASFAYGKVVHEGMTLAIVGRPNVGKSSLFNRLVERERAIVTSTPGTTRDLVTETVAIGGIPVRLVDTAGIRAASDEAESIGIAKTMEAIADADLVLVVLDLVGSMLESERNPLATPFVEDNALLETTEGRNRIVVLNKIDLELTFRDLPGGRAYGFTHEPTPEERQKIEHVIETGSRLKLMVDWIQAKAGGLAAVATSALTGEGIEELRRAILVSIGGDAAQQETGFLTNARHQALVSASLNSLDAATAAVQNATPHEMLLLDLYGALRPLDEITGATSADDILNLIFSSFCIGK
jgi:tRNA modification GTPase